MIDDGYIKFNCNWLKQTIDILNADFKTINQWREKLYKLGLIGMYDNGIGFGNLSLRITQKEFLITGSATGEKPVLTIDDYAIVNDWSIEKNEIACHGLIRASSESLSHAALYESDPEINAAIHIHSKKMWNNYYDKLPTSPKDVSYGTPEMGLSLKKLLNQAKSRNIKVMVMGGHTDGLISYGSEMKEAGNAILNYFTTP